MQLERPLHRRPTECLSNYCRRIDCYLSVLRGAPDALTGQHFASVPRAMQEFCSVLFCGLDARWDGRLKVRKLRLCLACPDRLGIRSFTVTTFCSCGGEALGWHTERQHTVNSTWMATQDVSLRKRYVLADCSARSSHGLERLATRLPRPCCCAGWIVQFFHESAPSTREKIQLASISLSICFATTSSAAGAGGR